MNSKIILILLISQAITLANASPLLYKDFGASCDRDACASFCLKQWNPWPDGYGITPSCSVNPISVPGWVAVRCECLGPA